MSNGSGSGISLGGSLNIDSNVIIALGGLTLAGLVGMWLMNNDDAQKRMRGNMLSYQATSYAARRQVDGIADRLAQNVPSAVRPAARPALWRSASRHLPAVQQAIAKMRSAQELYHQGKIGLDELALARSEFQATKRYVTEETQEDVKVPTQHPFHMGWMNPLWRQQAPLMAQSSLAYSYAARRNLKDPRLNDPRLSRGRRTGKKSTSTGTGHYNPRLLAGILGGIIPHPTTTTSTGTGTTTTSTGTGTSTTTTGTSTGTVTTTGSTTGLSRTGGIVNLPNILSMTPGVPASAINNLRPKWATLQSRWQLVLARLRAIFGGGILGNLFAPTGTIGGIFGQPPAPAPTCVAPQVLVNGVCTTPTTTTT